jgi:hypothetical protein
MHAFDGRRGGHRREKPESALHGIFQEWIGLGQGEVFHNIFIVPWIIPQRFKRSILASAARPEGLLFINLPKRFGR